MSTAGIRPLLVAALVSAPVALALACGDSGGESEGTAVSTSTSTGGGSSGTAGETSGTTTGGAAGWHDSLKVGVEHGAFLSVWGPSPTEVYAVGGQLEDGGSRGMIFQWDGAAWGEIDLPEGTPSLNWVTGVDGDLWVVGYEGAALRREGGTWAAHPTGTTSLLWGIWGSGADDVWTVGGDGVDDDPVLLHWDGAAWSSATLPAIDPESHALFKIWGSAADDVTVVGDRGVALHYDGANWSSHDTGSISDLISVWGPGDKSAVAVGGRANGRIARWDGAAWSGEILTLPGLNGVWVDGAGVATIVGWQGTIATLEPGSFAPTTEESGTILLLHGVHGFEGGPTFAVGGSINAAPPFVGVIVMRD
ncbi:MAG: hypothetical protein H6710_23285 [Myxococcales bacterium]|nr:hypothetical protein [Myxococcales bacterium]